MKVGIIGVGIVGGAIKEACLTVDEFKKHLSCFDKFHPERNLNERALADSELIFVCVPTPTSELGIQYSAHLVDVMEWLSVNQFKGVVCVKSTVLPGTMSAIAKEYPGLRLIHSPEFLTVKNATNDFLKASYILVSGKTRDWTVLDKFNDILGVPQTISSHVYEVTEYAKYIHNCALPVMLSLLNEFRELVVRGNDESVFQEALTMASTQGNLTRLHQVPGPDGKFGWGGACFPKDTLAFLRFATQRGYTLPTLNGAVVTNMALRPDEMNFKEPQND